MIAAIVIVVIVALLWTIAGNSTRTRESQERMERQQHDSRYPDVPAEIQERAQKGDRIGAIAAYRQLTGCSLEIASAKIVPAQASTNAWPLAIGVALLGMTVLTVWGILYSG